MRTPLPSVGQPARGERITQIVHRSVAQALGSAEELLELREPAEGRGVGQAVGKPIPC
ncbi:hypothetical protein [Streptomyces carpinensis]|uniref:Uncharacterized protein n=1 Tax=Streptomyces carpinensis TaxID=66369 RepID=A0ABV1VZ55_9ACTN|nr:hypothetical protein [Streptomyces carpinensis]